MRLSFDPAHGGRAASWVVETAHGPVELLARHSDAAIDWGMYAMAPWAGRIRGNAVPTAAPGAPMPANHGGFAIHGTSLWREADVAAHGPASIAFAQDLGWWPHAGTVRTTWALGTEDGTAVLDTSIVVTSDETRFPATVGWHPWFRRRIAGATAHYDLPAREMLVRGEDALPTGERRAFADRPGTFDDAFDVPSMRASIAWADAVRIDITSSEPWFVVFDELPDGLCIEPQSGPPDGLRAHSGWEPRIVAPGAPLELRTRWSVVTG